MNKGKEMRLSPLGDIPRDWCYTTISDALSPGSKVTYGVVQPGGEDINGVKFVRGGDIKSGKISNNLRTISHTVSESYSRTLLKGGEVLISLVGYPGQSAVVPKELAGANIARQVALLSLSDDFEPYFVHYFLSSELGQKLLLSNLNGSAQQVINLKDLAKVLIPKVLLKEQQKIAEILSTVDKKIDLIDQKIAETVKLKTGLMQKLFSEGVGVQDSDGNWQPHSEFQDSPFGKVPSSWALETLEQRLDVIKDGTHFSPKSKEGPCKYLTSKNIRFGELDLTNISYISQEEHDRIYKGSPVKYGDILLTKDGANTGNAAINTLEEPFSLLSSVAYLRGSEKDVDHGYLLQLLLSPKGQSMMKSAMAGQAITRLTLKKIGAFVLPFAPIDEQNEIERILSTVDKKLQLLKKQKSETQQLKKGLMQKLLTGEWRVPVEETEAA
ncbi:TPA: restriction endonuclease subunit S [Vibrio cholerae]|nr:restriction endonuclease subunit S [Vibrio cholerae]EKF9095525.1 restriction endonuclease subunit S [Vibrio cholerae]HEJ2445325.1 restriction endonuclease subunit S [Vibrio cholerae]